jgi:ElaB/YqjD/DUF883 family membrane-anchored ribosome-binding protein
MAEEPRHIGPGGTTGPRSVAEARLAVQSSRERISSTIDELEYRIVDKKEELRERLDVTRPVRAVVDASPLIAIGAAAGAGLLLGLVSKGRPRRKPPAEVQLSDRDRQALRRWREERRKRLLQTAGDELPRFEPPPSRFRRLARDLAHDFAGAATGILIATIVDRVKDAEEYY